MKIKKLSGICIALIMVFAFLTVPANAEETKIVYVSDMEWIKATCHSSKSEPVRDASFDEQNMLTIDGEEYQKGIGTHARDAGWDDAEITVNVPEGASLFEAVVGLDDNMSPDSGNGSVEFIVLVDDQQVASSGIMNAQSPNYTFSINVSGAKTITLRTTNGQDSAGYDAADWCDAKFVIKAEQNNPEQNPSSGDTNMSAMFALTVIICTVVLVMKKRAEIKMY